MLIILEGPEAAGKTTLANQLILNRSRKCNVHYFRHTLGDSNHQRIMADLEFALARPYDLVIFDRWWLSELVYRPHDGKPSTLPLEGETLEKRYGGLADSAGLRLLVMADAMTLTNRRQARQAQGLNDDISIPPDVEVRKYEQEAARWNWLLCSWGYTPTIQDIVDAKWAKIIKDFERWPTHPPLDYAGERQRQANLTPYPHIWRG